MQELKIILYEENKAVIHDTLSRGGCHRYFHHNGQSCYNGENRELSQCSVVKTKKWQIIHHFVLIPLKGNLWPFLPESMKKLNSKNGRKFALHFGHGENGTHFRQDCDVI